MVLCSRNSLMFGNNFLEVNKLACRSRNSIMLMLNSATNLFQVFWNEFCPNNSSERRIILDWRMGNELSVAQVKILDISKKICTQNYLVIFGKLWLVPFIWIVIAIYSKFGMWWDVMFICMWLVSVTRFRFVSKIGNKFENFHFFMGSSWLEVNRW